MMQLSMYETELASQDQLAKSSQQQAVPYGIDDSSNDEDISNVTEIILSKKKAESVQMLLPMLTHLSQENRWLAWIDPPVQMLKNWREKYQNGELTNSIMVLKSSDKHSALDLTKLALEAGTCHAVVTWTNGLSSQGFEQLENASKLGNSHGIVLRLR